MFNFFSKFFKKEENKINAALNVNNDTMTNLRNAISDNIETLNKELLGYDYLRKYIEIYSLKLNAYYEYTKVEYDKVAAKLATLSNQTEEEYAEYLEYSSVVQILKDKVSRFETSRFLMKQELLRIHQAIVNHFITINALKTSRDDIIPLIGSELLINIGKNSENNALEISNNLINLFHNILDQNVVETEKNLEALKGTVLPDVTIEKIQRDISSYIEGVNSANIKSNTDDDQKLKLTFNE